MASNPPFQTMQSGAELTASFRFNRWSPGLCQAALVVSLLLPLVALVNVSGLGTVLQGMLAFLLTAFWQFLFSRFRHQKPGFDLLVTGLLFTLMLPLGFSIWELILGISFGVVVGEQLYGGRGFSFLHPVIVGLAFLLYAFPEVHPVISHSMISAAMVPGLLLLLTFRLLHWRALLSLIIGVLTMHLALMHTIPLVLPGSMIIGGVLFAVLDSAVGTATRPGRWLYGFLVGALIVLFDPTLQSLHAVVFAALLGSIAAPLAPPTALIIY